MPQFHRFQQKVWRYTSLYGLMIAGFGMLVWNTGSPSPDRLNHTSTENSMTESTTATSLRMAGSGSNLPLTRRLIQGFVQQFPQYRTDIQLFPSIGTSGGIQAVKDRVIQLGLLSRPLKSSEKQSGLIVVPYARVAVVVAVHHAVPIKNMTRSLLFQIYRGLYTMWTPTLPVVVLQREQGDSSHEAIYHRLPSFVAINERAYQQQQWQVIYRDQQMQDALTQTPGAIGIFDLGAIVSQRLPVRVLPWHGIAPSSQHVLHGHYPFFKELSFVYKAQTCQRGQLCHRFLSFVGSPSGRKLIQNHGYIPWIESHNTQPSSKPTTP